MLAKSAAKEDSAAAVTPEIQVRTPWRVDEVRPAAGFCLHVRFIDGLEGEVDMAELIHSSTAGVFAQLADPAKFAEVYVEHGAVRWPGEIDLAPDAMHRAIAQGGKWILRG